MKKFILFLCVSLVSTTALWASNTITYTATNKLSGDGGSLDIDKTTFGPAITSHTFTNGTGTIICSGEITAIGSRAFYGCSGLISINIPNSVTEIGEEAFGYCTDLTSVTIPNSVTTIGNYAFVYCTGLTSITIPNSVTTIGVGAFSSCNVKSVTWNAKNCNGYNFGSQVETFIFGDEVEIIPDGLCSGMEKLTSITIPNSVTAIGDYTFYNCCGLTSITIPNSVTKIGGVLSPAAKV